MKIRHHTIAALAVWSGLTGSFALAQDAPIAQPTPTGIAIEADLDIIAAPAKRRAAITIEAPGAEEQVLLSQVGLSQDWPLGNLNQTGGSELTLTSGDFRYDGFGGTARPRTLMIRSGDTDQKTLSNLEEDLNVMSRIFAKALKEKGTDEDPLTAMGMKIRTLNVSSQSGVQNIYLDGYGALFLFNVRFPLLPPPEAPEKETSKEPADSTWEEAKRELYGSKDSGANERVWDVRALGFISNRQREEYDAKKVAKLKESLLHALKNATNIRKLKSDDFITVAVTGADNVAVKTWTLNNVLSSPGARRSEVQINEKDGAVVRRAVRDVRGATGETMMTIRVKKSDVDAFAKGSLTFEDFQKKASIAVY